MVGWINNKGDLDVVEEKKLLSLPGIESRSSSA
jgi:hypothetical protein